MEGEGERRGRDKWWKRILFADEVVRRKNVAERKNGRRPHLNLCGCLEGAKRQCDGERASRRARGRKSEMREKELLMRGTEKVACSCVEERSKSWKERKGEGRERRWREKQKLKREKRRRERERSWREREEVEGGWEWREKERSEKERGWRGKERSWREGKAEDREKLQKQRSRSEIKAEEREGPKWKRTDYQRRESRGPRGARTLAHARRAWERALTFRRCPLFLFHSIRSALLSVPSFSLYLSRFLDSSRLPFFLRYILLYSLTPGPKECSLSPTKVSGRGSPITAECARSKAPRAWSYSFRGAQYLGDRCCEWVVGKIDSCVRYWGTTPHSCVSGRITICVVSRRTLRK